MSNNYETLRPIVVKLVQDICVKVATDNSATAYNWSIGKLFGEAEKSFTEYLLNGKLPPVLKDIIRFEFNKLKDAVMTNENWQALRSRETYIFTSGNIEKRRNDTFGLRVISLEEQLKGAQVLFDKVGKALAKSQNEETTLRLKKRERSLMKELDFLHQEISRQNSLKTTVAIVETVNA